MAFVLAGCLWAAAAEPDQKNVLPAYVYTGEDPMIGAVAAYLVESGYDDYEPERISVLIPAPVILKTVLEDDGHAVVYGNFWRMRYTKENNVLVCVMGGEAAGVMRLEYTDPVWKVVSFEQAGDGAEYARDIRRFCKGDRLLEAHYFLAQDARRSPVKDVRKQLIRAYVEANQLDIVAYQDPYWEPVPLND